MIRKRAATMIAAAAACSLAAGIARSAPPETAGEPAKQRARWASRPPTAADFAALKQRVDQQDELILRLTQLESEHYEMLVKLLRERRPGAASVVLPPPPPPPAGGQLPPR